MKKPGSRWLWFGLAGIALGVLWMLATPPVYADHYVYRAKRYNDTGEGDKTVAMKTWAIEGQTTRYCVGPQVQRQAIFDAIGDWESQFAFPYNEFRHECGSAQRMDVVDNVGWQGYSCSQGPNVAGCVQPFWAVDSTRNGRYIDYMRVWVNTRDNAFTYSGMRATIAHEVGHVYGLDEAYLHDPLYACNPAITSIMDGLKRDSNGAFSNGCDANGPTSYDNNNAAQFYVMVSWEFQPQDLRSYKIATDRMDVYWDDASPTESGYDMYAFFWTGSAWQQYENVFYSYHVASGDPWQHTRLNRAFYRYWYQPVNWYISCMYVNSGVIGNRYWKCFPMQWLGSWPG